MQKTTQLPTIKIKHKKYVPQEIFSEPVAQKNTRELFLACLTMPQTTKLCKEFFPAVFGTFRPGDKHKTRVYRLVTHLQQQPYTVVQAVHEHVRNQNKNIYDQMKAGT